MQRVTPCLWFDDRAEEAASFYTTLFRNGRVTSTTYYTADTPSEKPIGSVLTVTFTLDDLEFTALNGGSIFTPNPSISFFVSRESKVEIDELWAALSDGGQILMPLQAYPFSEYYGWVQDRFGVSWQLILPSPEGEKRPSIVPSFLFVGEVCGRAAAAIEHYTSIFPNSQKGLAVPYGPNEMQENEEHLMYADFALDGQWFAAMDSGLGHKFAFGEGISLAVNCETQDEIDYYWEKLSAVPEAEVCGWLKDAFGVSWQIVPTELGEILNGPDTERAKRVMEAMLQMKKIDLEALKNV